MLVSEIITHVRRMFGDTNSVEITDADIIRWINASMSEIVPSLDLMQTKASTTPISGVSHYALPTDLLKLHSIKFKGISLDFLSLEQAEKLVPNKDDATNYPTGTPTHYWIWGGEVYLYPSPSTNGAAELVCYYNRSPVSVTTTGDTPEVPSVYHNRIVEYCLAQAYELDGDMQAAQAKMNEFRGGVDNMSSLSAWESQDFYPFITDLAEADGYYPNG